MAESSSPPNADGKETVNLSDDDKGITMVDVLKEEEELEEDANAVLGASDDQNCTYSQGYVKRQALYACLTCTNPNPENGTFQPAGICLACSYNCHENHKLVELYTKRNFRCDCGNEKFGNNKCILDPVKDKQNVGNSYNQNFSGAYCTCSRPYPDPEDDTEDQMIQCVICEDWHHGRHLGSTIPGENDYSEMICSACMLKYEFIQCYVGYAVTTVQKTDESQELNLSAVEKSFDSIDETAVGSCKKLANTYSGNGAVFWPDGWRKHLCSCSECVALYAEKSVSYLLDDMDTVQAYEEKGKLKRVSQYERGMAALSNMDRIQQVEAIHGYNDMKTHLKEYLAKFAENKKVVREEDIREFFTGLEARKKQNTGTGVPFFCR